MADLWANSSSSSFRRPWNSDVYISFRGKDTRRNFTGYLYYAFCQNGVRTFMDSRLERSEENSQALIRGMEQSRISIVIFSLNYASSTRCLDELAKIMELRETKVQLVIPIFYHIEPYDVGHERGLFREDMLDRKAKFGAGSERVQRWTLALQKAAELSGWLILDGNDESEYIQKITEDIIGRLKLFSVETKNLRKCESLSTIPEMSVIIGDRWANSSSSPFQHPWKYDVYVSFRGADTRRTFTAHLCKAFCDKGINVFSDDRVERGEEIVQALFRAEKHSRISVIILSESYASSTFCLEELLASLENMKTKGQLVIPVFYKVDPSDIRHQRNSFKEALVRHEERFGFGSERIQRWRWALTEVANLSGWHLDGYSYEFQHIQRITENVIQRLKSLSAEAENLRGFQGPASQNRNFSYFAEILGKQFKGFEFKSLSSMDLRECEFFRTVPDMSAAQNLTELLLDFCINLVEIHDSVGFLGKLVMLSARHCSKLERFPRKIRLVSLQHLDLYGNYSFQFFPEVLVKMENIRQVSLGRTSIKELPYSIGKLSGLRLLTLNYYRIRYLPRSIGMLTNLTEISMACCPLVFQSLKGNINSGTSRYYLVQKLNINRCDLLDEDLPVIVHCFPYTKYLDLSGNKFVRISTCIKELYYLEKFYLTNCKMLEEIEGIPPHLVLLSATNCNRLTLESINRLGLAHQESPDKKFEVKLPGTRIPECFNHYIGEGRMSFWVCQSIPNVALCLEFELEGEEKLEKPFDFRCDIWIQVNGLPILQHESYMELRTSHHVLLIHLHSYIEYFKNADISEWSHVEIFWEVKYYPQIHLKVARPGRVHIRGKETDMGNVLSWKGKIQSSIPSDGDCSFSQTTNVGESETYDSQDGDCSFSQTRPDYENEAYNCLGRDDKRKSCYKNKQEDLSIGLIWHCSRNDPITLICEKCYTKGQGKETNTMWDPMEIGYQVTCLKDQRNNRDVRNDQMIGPNQESRRWLSLCALISSLVSLCSASFEFPRLTS